MPDGPEMRHIPALDGLRGIAVAGVLLFHLGHLRGGYLGVDAFFVLSGYLITSLLVTEHRRRGTIALGHFWGRRARRLLPALLVLVAAIAAYAWLVAAPAELAPLRGDALATLGYVANWHAIVGGTSYFDLFRSRSLLEHTWSLAIEEQFYLVWPLVVLAVLRLSRGRWRVLLAVTVVLAAASVATMSLLYRPGADVTRLYDGTDTRASSVLFGAALAVVVWSHPDFGRGRVGWVLEAFAWVAVAGLAWAWMTVGGSSAGLYQGGLALCGLGVLAVIAAVVRTTPGPLARALSAPPLCALGAISYGLYLYHWPIYVVMTPTSTQLDGLALDAAKLGATVLAAVVSYRFIEMPVRNGRPAFAWGSRGWLTAAGALVGVLVLVVATTSPRLVPGVGTSSSQASAAALGDQSLGPPAAPGDTRRVLVVGDSGTSFFGEALERHQGDTGLTVDAQGQNGCGIIRDGGRVRLDAGGYLEDPPGCHDYLDRWDRAADDFGPDVAVLVLAWPGIGDRFVDGSWQHPCDPGFDAMYQGTVTEGLAHLARIAPATAITTAPYYVGTNSVPPNARDRVDCLNETYRAAAGAAGATVIDLAAMTCPGGDCLTTVDGAELRADGLHFLDAGGDVEVRWLAPELRRLAS